MFQFKWLQTNILIISLSKCFKVNRFVYLFCNKLHVLEHHFRSAYKLWYFLHLDIAFMFPKKIFDVHNFISSLYEYKYFVEMYIRNNYLYPSSDPISSHCVCISFNLIDSRSKWIRICQIVIPKLQKWKKYLGKHCL